VNSWSGQRENNHMSLLHDYLTDPSPLRIETDISLESGPHLDLLKYYIDPYDCDSYA
jgi:hypothetical protein